MRFAKWKVVLKSSQTGFGARLILFQVELFCALDRVWELGFLGNKDPAIITRAEIITT